jgi:hypothetical protein
MISMWCRGRSFAAGALVMLLAQFTLVCAAPLAACTMSSAAASSERSEVDCCPAGSHPPGQCPLHKREAPAVGCRLTCATQGSTPFIPGFVGVLAPAGVQAPVVVSEPADLPPSPARLSTSLPPISPPPKRLA